jgi:hypothetical protein
MGAAMTKRTRPEWCPRGWPYCDGWQWCPRGWPYCDGWQTTGCGLGVVDACPHLAQHVDLDQVRCLRPTPSGPILWEAPEAEPTLTCCDEPGLLACAECAAEWVSAPRIPGDEP